MVLKVWENFITSLLHEWLSGGVSPCQGEGRGFESRLVLFLLPFQPVGDPAARSPGSVFYIHRNAASCGALFISIETRPPAERFLLHRNAISYKTKKLRTNNSSTAFHITLFSFLSYRSFLFYSYSFFFYLGDLSLLSQLSPVILFHEKNRIDQIVHVHKLISLEHKLPVHKQ